MMNLQESEKRKEGILEIDEIFSETTACKTVKKQQRKESEKNISKDIAIVGISGRFPGADNIEEFWDNLINGISSIEEVPSMRWDINKYYDSDVTNKKATYLRKGGFINRFDEFDPLFFNMSGKEAELTDPQQRLFLEEGYHALEDAGYTKEKLSNVRCGVFVGVKEGDYQIRLSEVGLAHEAQAFWGNDTSVISGRVSYFLDLKGPSVAINTACSSSLYAIHLACENIWMNEIDLAVAGGVFISLTPSGYIISSNANMITKDGKCKAFDDRADGFVPGEAVGAIILKPLDLAVREGDYIYGVIKGSGVNQDGHTNGITAPSARSQSDLEASVYKKFGINPETIQYVETHGTGTKLGDPIEFEALTNSFRQYTNKVGYCAIGSVKTNIGHAACGAGVASVIKVLLALKNKQIPPSLNFEKPNQFIQFEGSPFYVNTNAIMWESSDRDLRRAAVSSFGFSGTNVHLVIEGFDNTIKREKEFFVYCLPFSAKTKNSLYKKINEFLGYMKKTDYPLVNIAYTLQVAREHFEYRVAFLAHSKEELIEQLSKFDEDQICFCDANNTQEFVEELDRDNNYEEIIKVIKKRYLEGNHINWNVLYGDEKIEKVPLLLYPFENERCWFEYPSEKDEVFIYSKEINSNQTVLAHHQVKGEYLLPGVAYLELVNQAAKTVLKNSDFTISQVIWKKPFKINQDTSKEIGVYIKQSDASWEFEIKSGANQEVHASGKILLIKEEYRNDVYFIESVKRTFDYQVKGELLYEKMAELGVCYGNYFKTIKDIWVKDNHLIAELVVRNEYIEEMKNYTYYPALMDSAIQAVLGFVINKSYKRTSPNVPFSVEQVRYLKPLERHMYVHIRGISQDVFEIELQNTQGDVCVLMKNLVLRNLKGVSNPFVFEPQYKLMNYVQKNSQKSGVGLVIYSEEGKSLKDSIVSFGNDDEYYECLIGRDTKRLANNKYEIASDDFSAWENLSSVLEKAETIYFISSIQSSSCKLDDLEQLKKATQRGVITLFRLVQALIKLGREQDSITLNVITNNQYFESSQKDNGTFQSSMQGMIMTLAKEYRKWNVKHVDIDWNEFQKIRVHNSTNDWIKKVIVPPEILTGQTLFYRRNQYYKQSFIPVEFDGMKETVYRKGGVYLIVGGAGGIGKELSLYLAKKVKAKLVLLGRRPENEQIKKQILELKEFGSQVIYLQADCTDLNSMEKAISQAKRCFGKIDGAFHSAIVLKDKLIKNMSEDIFNEVLLPKVDGSLILYKVLKDESLDFLVYLSSMQSFIGNIGQSNYAAGCTFEDEYAKILNSSSNFPVRTINWGYWGNIGIVSGENYQEHFTSQGAIALDPEESFEMMEELLESPVAQVLAFKASKDILEQMGVDWNYEITYPLVRNQNYLSDVFTQVKEEHEISDKDIYKNDESIYELNHFAALLLLKYFRELNVFVHEKEQYSYKELRAKLNIIPEYERMFKAFLHILEENQWVLLRDDQIIGQPGTLEIILPDVNTKEAMITNHPDLRSHIELLWVCTNSYKDVLTGKLSYVEVMFPEGKMSLVEGIYKGDDLSDYFNQYIAQLIKTYCKRIGEQSGKGSIRILEVGAGTGGTSENVLKVLEQVDSEIDIHYYYTDVSAKFINYGEERFKNDKIQLQFKTLNIEEDPMMQGFESQNMDIVLASNVLHATKNITITLNQIKKLLKKNGVVIINENTKQQIFGTLTFGLTSGWWLFEDENVRIPDSPLLSIEDWKTLIALEGFTSVDSIGVPGMETVESYQSVIVAESNGGMLRNKEQEKQAKNKQLAEINDEALEVAVQDVDKEDLYLRTVEYSKGVFAEILHIRKESIMLNETYEKYGVDSLIITELTKRFEHDLGTLPMTLLFEYNTLDMLTGYFVENKKTDLCKLFDFIQPIKDKKVTDIENNNKGFDTKNTKELDNNDIAIIGMSGRYPMGSNFEIFWNNLVNKKNGITEIPKDRWDYADYYEEETTKKGKSYTKWGGFIEDYDKFDPLFFNISPLEAAAIDPQERLFLQNAWETLEDAGYLRHNLNEMDFEVGVFAGVMNGNYEDIGGAEWGKGNFTGAHSAYWSVSNRVSYFFNLQGPSLTIDTACSSSLTAIHMACESLRNGECKAALAGGVNLILHPIHYARLTGMNMLSHGNQCRAFGEGGDGFIDGEGVGAVLLKPLNKAKEDGDHIYGVIKGSFINSGGKTSGYTVPNPNAQAKVVAEAIRRAKVSPLSIGYIEAHGTGTSLGDPIEVRGLKKAFFDCVSSSWERERLKEKYCAIGSLKSNIGHLEAASGIASLTKVLLMFEHKQILPSINADTINSKVDFTDSPFYLIRENKEWKKIEKPDGDYYPRRAGISSFGAGGANAHIIVEEYVDKEEMTDTSSTGEHLIVLSAKNEKRLLEQAERLNEYVGSLFDESSLDESPEYTDFVEKVKHALLKEVSEILEITENEINMDEEWVYLGFVPWKMNILCNFVRETYDLEIQEQDISSLETMNKLIEYLVKYTFDATRTSYQPKVKDDVSLADVAYTLQIGREAMEYRLAIIAKDFLDLSVKLKSFISGEYEQKDIFVKDKKQYSPRLEETELTKLAKRWVDMEEVGWKPFYRNQKARKISLPTYAFEKKSYFVKQQAENQTSMREQVELLDRVIPKFSEQSIEYEKILNSSDWIVEDHQVNGQRMLPGVGYVAMANYAIEQVNPDQPFEIKQVVWLNPLVVDTKQSTRACLQLVQKGEKISYQVSTYNGKVVHSTGILEKSGAIKDNEVIPFEAIKERCSIELEEDLYQIYDDMGIHYGPNYQTVKRVYVNEAEILAQLEYNIGKSTLEGTDVIGMLDGALQCILVLMAFKGNRDKTLRVPFSVEKVEFFDKIRSKLYAYVKEIGTGQFNICLIDETGKIYVRFTKISSRPLNKVPVKEEETINYYTSKWSIYPTVKENIDDFGKHVLILYGNNEYSKNMAQELAQLHKKGHVEKCLVHGNVDWKNHLISQVDVIYYLVGLQAQNNTTLSSIEDAQKEGILSLFELVKAMDMAFGNRKNIVLKVVTNHVFSVIEGEEIYPAYAAMKGFIKSLAKEYPQWQISDLDVDESINAYEIATEPAQKNGETIALRNHQRYISLLETTNLISKNHRAFRNNGTYIIVGGAGGIGFTLTRYLLDKYEANVIITGRRELNKTEVATIINSMNKKDSCGKIHYIKADITLLDDIKRVVDETKEKYGKINGVFHSAIVLKDATIHTMEKQTLTDVLAPKLIGSYNLFEAFKDETLDFITIFSSAQSFMGNMGQSNYAAACTFKDSYAMYRSNKVSYPIKIVNWGYWGSVGVVATQEYKKELKEKGIYSIETEEGLKALEIFLVNDVSQVSILKLSEVTKEIMQIKADEYRIYGNKEYDSIFDEVTQITVPKISTPEEVDQLKESVSILDEVAHVLLAKVFLNEELIKETSQVILIETLEKRLKVTPKYHKLYLALLDILERSGYIEVNDKKVTIFGLHEKPELRQRLKECSSFVSKAKEKYPLISNQLTLLCKTMEHFADIVSGKIQATEIVFPNGSMDLVEGIYKNNKMADALNLLVATIVKNFVVNLNNSILGSRTITILEIGAGTGGTTKGVLEAIGSLGINLKYIYSDISKSFINHGQKVFKEYPFVSYQVIDIEKDLKQQQMEYETVDLVIAANVLHATKNLGETLEQVKRLLKPNGCLVLNEATKLSDQTTLTFGLLDGWWLYEDEMVRISHAPLLNEGMWEQLLKTHGFTKVHAVLEKAEQNIIIAESNGNYISVTGSETIISENKDIQVESKTIVNTNSNFVEEPLHKKEVVKLQDEVKRIIANIIQADLESVDENVPFSDFGIDSILAVEIVKQLNDKLHITMAATDLFNYSTIADLSTYINKEWGTSLVILEEISPSIVEVQKANFTELNEEASEIESCQYTLDQMGAKEFQLEEIHPEEFQQDESKDESMDIAIIGISGEFPEAPNVEVFWENLCEGRNAIKEIPASRWNMEEKLKDVKLYGGCLDDIDKFDPLFFHLSPKEAEWMDPQQRRFLQIAWSTLEDAGYTDTMLNGRKCGVFVGCGSGDYISNAKKEDAKAYAFTGNSNAILSARISYLLNLRGPSLAIDTACSSSLVAVHMACESLLTGTCEMALAGGVSIPTSPQFHLFASSAGLLTKSGRCSAFDKDADGFIPGEGVGAVLLKPLKQAIQDKDYIYAVIKGSGVNQDGKSNGITSPNGQAQTDLEKEVYEKYHINPETIGYIEAHGTGTKLGDPIEIQSLTNAFREYTDKLEYCAIGSVKTNIGHALTASGIASLIKVVECLQNKKLVPSLHFKEENPHYKLGATPFYVNTECKHWDNISDTKRRAAISSFGFSGTNAHMVLEEYEMDSEMDYDEARSNEKYCIVLSAKTEESLGRKVSSMIKWLENHEHTYSLKDISYTLNTGRIAMEERIAFITSSKEQWKDQLVRYLQGESCEDIITKESNSLLEVDEQRKIYMTARRFVNGEIINWFSLYNQSSCQRIPLPSYPFERNSFWIKKEVKGKAKEKDTEIDKGKGKEKDTEINKDKDTEKVSVFKETACTNQIITKINGSETIFDDHKVMGKTVFPGVGYLELVRDAFTKDHDVGLSVFENIYWLAPMYMGEMEKEILISYNQEKECTEYKIQTEDLSKSMLHFQTKIRPPMNDIIPEVGIDHMMNEYQFLIKKEDIYHMFDELGLNYGPAFQCLECVIGKEGEALGVLSIEESYTKLLNEYKLHPGLMDSALQVIVGLITHDNKEDTPLLMPYSVKRIHFIRPLKTQCYSYVKKVGEYSYDLFILGEDKKVDVYFENLTLRGIKRQEELSYYRPLWVNNPIEKKEKNPEKDILLVYSTFNSDLKEKLSMYCSGSRVHSLCIDESFDKQAMLEKLRKFDNLDTIYYIAGTGFSDHLDDSVYLKLSQNFSLKQVFNLFKCLITMKFGDKKLTVKVITDDVYMVGQVKETSPYASSVIGFVKSVAKEFPLWDISCIDIDDSDEAIRQITYEAGCSMGEEVVLRDTKRYKRVLAPIRIEKASKPIYLQNGVYVIVGGLSGIGLELSKHLVKNYKARLVIIGRSPLTDDKKKAYDLLINLGGEVLYIQGNIMDFASMETGIKKARKEFGPINGVFHSAIVLKDKLFIQMSEPEFMEALIPKIYGSSILYQIFKEDKLDFMVFLSSIQSFVGNIGQCNYAAASTFQDCFARSIRTKVDYPVYVINWGYWGKVGIVSNEQYRTQFNAQGIQSIDVEEGMNAIQHVLQQKESQLAVMKVNNDILKLLGGLENELFSEEEISEIVKEADQVNVLPRENENYEVSFQKLHEISLKLIVYSLSKIGVFDLLDQFQNPHDIYRATGIIKDYYALMDSILDILIHGEVLNFHNGRFTYGSHFEQYLASLDEIEIEYADIQQNEQIKDYGRLLKTAIMAYPDVLIGKTGHMQVLFPNGSMHLVEPIYSKNKLADYYNQKVADFLKQYLLYRKHHDNGKIVKILEVGAGTGGTTSKIFDEIASCSDQFEYYYTDISKAFLDFGKQKYGDYSIKTRFKLLNIEEDPQKQDFDLGSMDIIVASNVLHATRIIDNTLNNCNKLLKTGGLLVINEATKLQDTATLTFGLTTGWWLFSDPEVRIKHSPLLSVECWEKVLSRKGFSCINVLGPTKDESLGQNVLISQKYEDA
jgi:acyl transferase domain-containing protein/NAD(P)-dependent dehydrogenase (short-subunit alcohol dehydrogenase family)/ubiquinone/menaquinone biosynthesis C-methylase UbiE/acyl carrier protein